MSDLWRAAFGCAHHCDDIQTEFAVDTSGLDIVIDGLTQILKFLIVDSLFRFCEHAVTAGFYFHEHHDIFLHGNDVDIAMTRLPVAFDDIIALAQKEGCCLFLTPCPKFIMCRHSLMYFAFRLQKYDIFPISRHPFGFFIPLVLH